MFKKIKNYVVAIAMVATFAAPAFVPAMASAAATDTSNALCNGANAALKGSPIPNDPAAAGNCADTGSTNLGTIAKNIVNILSLVVGAIAVIMIIIGGFRYIISGGESSNVSGAKNTLIYAIVGLIIVALAQFIVHFVLNTANGATS